MSEGLDRGLYVAARVGFEPATLRTQGTKLTTDPPRPTRYDEDNDNMLVMSTMALNMMMPMITLFMFVVPDDEGCSGIRLFFFIRLFNDASISKMIMRVSVRSLYLAYIVIIGCLLVSVAQPSAGVSKIYTVRHKKEPLEKSLLFDQESNNVNEICEIYI